MPNAMHTECTFAADMEPSDMTLEQAGGTERGNLVPRQRVNAMADADEPVVPRIKGCSLGIDAVLSEIGKVQRSASGHPVHEPLDWTRP